MKFVEELPKVTNSGNTRSGAWMEEAAALKSRPRTWALVATKDTASQAYGFTSNISNGILKAFPKGEFEAATRTIDGKHHVYARYVGSS